MSAISQEIYTYEMLCIYENNTVSDEGKILMSIHDNTLLVDEEFFASLFQIPQMECSASQMSILLILRICR